MVYPGNTQTDSIFMDSTLWWQTAEEEGIALAFVCETYNASPSSVSHADSDLFYHSLITLLKEKIDGKYADLDFSRIYGTGQSAGSNATQALPSQTQNSLPPSVPPQRPLFRKMRQINRSLR